MSGRYITFQEYINHPTRRKYDEITEDVFEQVIYNVEMSIDIFTYNRLRNKSFFDNLNEFRKDSLIRALVKTIEWWEERDEVLNEFGQFNSLSVGEIDLGVPRAFEDNPQAYWESMTLPTIAKKYLEIAGLRYAGGIA